MIQSGPALREGDRDARVPVLWRHLLITGDLPPAADIADEQFDAALAEGRRKAMEALTG